MNIEKVTVSGAKKKSRAQLANCLCQGKLESVSTENIEWKFSGPFGIPEREFHQVPPALQQGNITLFFLLQNILTSKSVFASEDALLALFE